MQSSEATKNIEMYHLKKLNKYNINYEVLFV